MLDAVLAVVILLSVLMAARNGFTKEAIGLTSVVVGILFAMWGHGLLAAELAPWIENPRVASGVAILLILVGCLVAGSLVARLLSDVWKWTGLRWMDMLLGAAFGVARGALVSGFVLLGLLAFQPFDSTPRIVAESRIAPWVINVARTVASLAPEALRDAFRRGVEAVEEENSVDRG